ncbi:MAG: ArsA-related P-loop ATPase, partial [Pseudomonadota bacterium]
REVFQLPRISQMMVELSKRVKRFRRVLIDSGQAALMAVTIPTQMAYEETRDLVAACERLGVGVPILFVNMVTPASRCPTCSALRRADELVLGRYDAVCAGRHVALVLRQEEPRGLERLRALGQAVYFAGRASARRQQLRPEVGLKSDLLSDLLSDLPTSDLHPEVGRASARRGTLNRC